MFCLQKVILFYVFFSKINYFFHKVMFQQKPNFTSPSNIANMSLLLNFYCFQYIGKQLNISFSGKIYLPNGSINVPENLASSEQALKPIALRNRSFLSGIIA